MDSAVRVSQVETLELGKRRGPVKWLAPSDALHDIEGVELARVVGDGRAVEVRVLAPRGAPPRPKPLPQPPLSQSSECKLFVKSFE